MIRSAFLILSFLLLYAVGPGAKAQGHLSRPIDIHLNKMRIADVLNRISKQAGFIFSYNSRLVPQDSLISLQVSDQPIALVLKDIFGERFRYEERRGYVIILPELRRLVLTNTDLVNDGRIYSVSGMVTDERSGTRLSDVSIFEKDRAVATLSDEHGYFRLRVRDDGLGPIRVIAAKADYADTSIVFLQTVSVSSTVRKHFSSGRSSADNDVERTGLGRLFITTRQKIQSLNIPGFFAHKNFQASLGPGLSTRGIFSPQVVNNVSVNLTGGYTGGTNGAELGGLFNINKADAKYLQLAGIFNLAGGQVTGLQLAGVHNRTLHTLKGLQIAGFINRAEAAVSGGQISLLTNQTRSLKGFQVGLINIADTSKGASLGLLNIVGNGFYRVSLSGSDLMNTNLSLRTGTHQFYTVITMGTHISQQQRLSAFGLGIGRDIPLASKLYASAELSYLFANTGSWDDRVWQGKVLLNLQVAEHWGLFAGPVYYRYDHSGNTHLPGYKNVTGLPDYPNFTTGGHQLKSWLGWEAGVAFNSIFKKRTTGKDTLPPSKWKLGIAGTLGIGWDQPLGKVYGTELTLLRDLGGHLTALVSAGYTHYTVNEQRTVSSSFIPATGTYEALRMTDLKTIPMKAGVRAFLGHRYFVEGSIGQSFGLNQTIIRISSDVSGQATSAGKVNSFIYSIGTGFAFRNGFELGIKFEDQTRLANYKQFAMRLAYDLDIGH